MTYAALSRVGATIEPGVHIPQLLKVRGTGVTRKYEVILGNIHISTVIQSTNVTPRSDSTLVILSCPQVH